MRINRYLSAFIVTNEEGNMSDTYKDSTPILPSEITPEHLYLSRRKFMQVAAALGVSAALAACGVAPQPAAAPTASGGASPLPAGPTPTVPGDELGSSATPYDDITNYNNYYEFSLDKQNVAPLSKDFSTSPWQVQVYGLVDNPKTYTIDDLKAFGQEQRIYRLRCVEAWSMVIPWIGFPLSKLLDEVKPTSAAKFVRFESVLRPEQMPGQKNPSFPWPYNEGLRLDEAMNDLAILATGMYGKDLPNQDGAPLRLVVPWKYGFKSIKAIVKIELVDSQPATMWNTISSQEYGFYSNVNPSVPHPRWSQSSERRIGELQRRATLMFNGYEQQVADLYQGMDLKANY